MIDGDAVTVGDMVFDVLLGVGQVRSTSSDGAFDVSFGRRTMRYATGGTASGVKRVYWRNPVLTIPRKGDAAEWELVRRLIAAVKG